MDINGEDITLETTYPPATSSMLMEAMCKSSWVEGVTERESDTEFFYYTSKEAKASWDEEGRTNQNGPEMVHVISESGSVSIIHERKDLAVEKLRVILK